MQHHQSTIAPSQKSEWSAIIETALLLLGIISTLSIIYISVQFDSHTSEASLIEISQSVILATAILICTFKQKNDATLNSFFSAITYLFLIVLVRELDQILEIFLPHGAWKVPAALLLLLLISFVAKNHSKIFKQLLTVSRQNGFTIAVIGCYIVFIFSRLAGLKDFWIMFMGDHYERDVKTLIEEGLELLGYTLMLIGVFSIRNPQSSAITQQNDDNELIQQQASLYDTIENH